MATNPAVKEGQSTVEPRYDGPIFDADSHIQERNFDMLAQYLPKKFHEDWLVQSRYDENGEYSLFLGSHKVENTEIADGVVFPPGKLKEWLRAIATGEEIDVRIPISPDMYTLKGRVEKLDEFGVEAACALSALMISTFGWLHVFGEKKGWEGPARRSTPTTSTCSTNGPSIIRTGSTDADAVLMGSRLGGEGSQMADR